MLTFILGMWRAISLFLMVTTSLLCLQPQAEGGDPFGNQSPPSGGQTTGPSVPPGTQPASPTSGQQNQQGLGPSLPQMDGPLSQAPRLQIPLDKISIEFDWERYSNPYSDTRLQDGPVNVIVKATINSIPSGAQVRVRYGRDANNLDQTAVMKPDRWNTHRGLMTFIDPAAEKGYYRIEVVDTNRQVLSSTPARQFETPLRQYRVFIVPNSNIQAPLNQMPYVDPDKIVFSEVKVKTYPTPFPHNPSLHRLRIQAKIDLPEELMSHGKLKDNIKAIFRYGTDPTFYEGYNGQYLDIKADGTIDTTTLLQPGGAPEKPVYYILQLVQDQYASGGGRVILKTTLSRPLDEQPNPPTDQRIEPFDPIRDTRAGFLAKPILARQADSQAKVVNGKTLAQFQAKVEFPSHASGLKLVVAHGASYDKFVPMTFAKGVWTANFGLDKVADPYHYQYQIQVVGPNWKPGDRPGVAIQTQRLKVLKTLPTPSVRILEHNAVGVKTKDNPFLWISDVGAKFSGSPHADVYFLYKKKGENNWKETLVNSALEGNRIGIGVQDPTAGEPGGSAYSYKFVVRLGEQVLASTPEQPLHITTQEERTQLNAILNQFQSNIRNRLIRRSPPAVMRFDIDLLNLTRPFKLPPGVKAQIIYRQQGTQQWSKAPLSRVTHSHSGTMDAHFFALARNLRRGARYEWQLQFVDARNNSLVTGQMDVISIP